MKLSRFSLGSGFQTLVWESICICVFGSLLTSLAPGSELTEDGHILMQKRISLPPRTEMWVEGMSELAALQRTVTAVVIAELLVPYGHLGVL